MSWIDTILAFDSASTAQEVPGYDLPMLNASLRLNPGELALYRFNSQTPRFPLADAAMGLIDLATGRVQFMTDDWHKLFPGTASAHRGQIGRLFGSHGWVFHLDVEENVTLSQRHHTRRSLADIEQETLALSAAFGLPTGPPQVRPGMVNAHDLQRSAAVRLLLGSPRLLIIDEPPTGLFPDVLAALLPQIQKMRSAGSAVLWITADPTFWTDATINPTFRGDASQPNLQLTDQAS